MIGLTCHPDTPSTAVRGIRARLVRGTDVLAVHYAIDADVAKLVIPTARAPRFTERLWQHSCCEIFVGRKGERAYREFNFSPSGEWAAYAFTRYREGAPVREADPRISVQVSAHELRLDANIGCAPGRLQLGISTVVEEENGTFSYWALAHPPGKPDFHHPDAFALELA